MRKVVLSALFVVMAVVAVLAQTPTKTITGNISSDMTFHNDTIYILSPGFHYVINNAKLTVEAGTIVRSTGGTLVVTRGAKLQALGTADQPVVFTSNNAPGSRTAGDWGGILLLGKARINDPAGERLGEGGIDAQLGLYGGTNNNDNSGALRYVRIEYAGVAYLPNNETNGLTMGGVGNRTKINYVQVSNGGDDSFEWFGGTVNCSYLVAYNGLDDDFDTDYGFSGRVQFGVGLRNPSIADVSTSNGWESDNDAGGTTNTPQTDATFSNFTEFGPIRMSPANSFNSLYGRGAHLRRSTQQDIRNSVIIGYKEGLRIEGTNTESYAINGQLQFKNNILAGNQTAIASVPGGLADMAWLIANSNTVNADPLFPDYRDPYGNIVPTDPDFRLNNGSPAATGSSFAGMTGFSNVPFVGAFSTTRDWTDCWCEFDPQNADYTVAPLNYDVVPTLSFSGSGVPSVANGDTLFINNPSNYSSIRWFRNGVLVPGTLNKSFIVPTQQGNYIARVTTVRGCVGKSATTFFCNSCEGRPAAEEAATAEDILFVDLAVSPNPSYGQFTVSFDVFEAGEATIQLMDMSGRQIDMTVVGVDKGMNAYEYNNGALPTGIYAVVVTIGKQQLVQKVTIL